MAAALGRPQSSTRTLAGQHVCCSKRKRHSSANTDHRLATASEQQSQPRRCTLISSLSRQFSWHEGADPDTSADTTGLQIRGSSTFSTYLTTAHGRRSADKPTGFTTCHSPYYRRCPPSLFECVSDLTRAYTTTQASLGDGASKMLDQGTQ